MRLRRLAAPSLAALLSAVAVAAPTAAEAARRPAWPIRDTPFMLTAEQCAARPDCADYVARDDAALETETPAERRARERAALGFRSSPRAERRLRAMFGEVFDLDDFQVSDRGDSPAERRVARALERRVARALDPRALERALQGRLAARGWSANDLGDLLALHTISSWKLANATDRSNAPADDAFRDGLRGWLARDPRTVRLTPTERLIGGRVAALMPIAVERLISAFPPAFRDDLRTEIAPSVTGMSRGLFGVDLARLRQVPTGFAPAR